MQMISKLNASFVHRKLQAELTFLLAYTSVEIYSYGTITRLSNGFKMVLDIFIHPPKT